MSFKLGDGRKVHLEPALVWAGADANITAAEVKAYNGHTVQSGLYILHGSHHSGGDHRAESWVYIRDLARTNMGVAGFRRWSQDAYVAHWSRDQIFRTDWFNTDDSKMGDITTYEIYFCGEV